MYADLSKVSATQQLRVGMMYAAEVRSEPHTLVAA